MQQAAAQPNSSMTLEEWAALPEDEPGELVDGQLVEEEVAGYIHEVVVAWFIHLFVAWLGERGFVGSSDAKFRVRPKRGRKPDLTVYLPGGRVPPGRGLITVPPDIAVEVITPTPRDARRDRVEKPDEYAEFGVRFYWLVDPELRTVEIYELGSDGRYTRAWAASDGTTTNVPGCDGLLMNLDALWARVDKLA
jgi:Uma2 family endonuclease